MGFVTKSKWLIKKKTVKDIKQGCPECGGDLVAHDELYALELFGLKILPLGKKRSHVYICDNCGHTYTPAVKYHSFLNDDERQAQVNSNNDIYARLMVASLAYTANIDGRFSNKEDELLEMVLVEAKEFPSAKVVLQKVLDLGKDAGRYVFSVFKFAAQHLSHERLESIIIANARMVLVDGRIKKPEKKLLQKYMKAADIHLPMTTVLARAHKEQYEAD